MRIKGFVLLEKNGKFLLIQEAAKKWKHKWSLPGGGIRSGETLYEGTLREVREEAGCDAELSFVMAVKRSGGFFNRKVTVYFLGEIKGKQIKTIPDEESLAVKWFDREEALKLPARNNVAEMIGLFYSHKDFIPAASFRPDF